MGSNGNYIKRGIRYFKRNGLTKTAFKAIERLQNDNVEKEYRPETVDEETLKFQRDHVFEHPYLFSILVPVYETDRELFFEMLESVGEQTYGNWELILADASSDDSRRNIVRDFTQKYNKHGRDRYGSIFDRVEYIRVPENKGISANTNIALSHARGDYIGLLDHDDILEKTALFDIMSAIDLCEQKGRSSDSIIRVKAVYTDEDKISADGGRYFTPHRKPDFDPVLLCTNNYICHFFVADADIARGTGGFRPGYDGAQDHDFILRCTEGVRRDQIIHVPKVLYHWRSTENSTAENPESKLYAYEAGKRAVSDHFRREGINVKVTDSPHLGFFELEYEPMKGKICTVTTEAFTETADADRLPDECEYLMILSSKLESVDCDHTDLMMSCMHLDHIGAVTGRIIGSDRRIESAGFDIDENDRMIPRFADLGRHFSGYMHRAVLDQLVGGFSTDCVLLRMSAVKRLFPKIELKDGFDIYYEPKAVFKRKST